jgi:hypothetical protein
LREWKDRRERIDVGGGGVLTLARRRGDGVICQLHRKERVRVRRRVE